MSITNRSKETLKASVDIVDIVGEYIEIKKNGANYKACCPFHGESTPSFVVSPSKQIYHCFGCGVGGDVFKFVQEYKKAGFQEAVEEVASRSNFVLEYTEGSERTDYAPVMDGMVRYYMDSMHEEHLDYLKNRGLTRKTIKEWQIGYAPRSSEQLKYISSVLLQERLALDVGIIGIDGDRKFARFSERIMFPIRSGVGKVVGFSGRSLKPDAKAKYINSTQSKLFDKSSLLFGFDKAKDAIYKKKFAIIMEGQLDVILCHQSGIQTAIATQGTALTESHLPQLRKTDAKIIVAYDGDKAGRAAALKAAQLLSLGGFAGGVVLFPEGQDPASMLCDGKEKEVKNLLSVWTPFVKFVLGAIADMYNLADPYQKSDALKACVSYLKSLQNDLIAHEHAGFVSFVLGVDVQHVFVGSYVASRNKNISNATSEEILLYTMYKNKGLVDDAVNICNTEAWRNKETYIALLNGSIDEETMGPILLKDGLVELEDKQFFAVLKTKQRQYLAAAKKKLHESGAMIEEIFAVNAKMKGL